MLNLTPRLRMFAGPNGSGKSTIKSAIREEILGVYVNPDEIEKEINKFDVFDFDWFGIQVKKEDVFEFLLGSLLLKKADLLDDVRALKFNDNKLSFYSVSNNSYFSSVIADFIRQNLAIQRKSFTFETVMSSHDKIDFLKNTKQIGYRNYLYFVATNDPLINISRVKYRVANGGHPVPEDKIISRYYRSLELLIEAIKYTDRAYIFDNSLDQQFLLAEITNAKDIELKSTEVPAWFEKYILDKI